MASTPFRHVTWGEEPVSKAKLEQMTSNDEYLLDNMMRASFRNLGGTKNTGLKFLGGSVYLPANKKDSTWANVYFGNFFSPGCRPVVVATPAMYPTQQVTCNIHGIGQIQNPDHRGFVVYCWIANTNKATISHGIRVHYQALGW